MRRAWFAVVAVVTGCSTDPGVPQDGDTPLPPTPPPTAELSLTPQIRDFGTVVLGQSAAAMFTVTNTGVALSGTIAAIATGAGAADFAVQTSCTRLAVADSCNATVTFTASSQGAETAALVVSASPGGAVMATLSVAAVSFSPLAISPTTFAFPDQAVNATSAMTAVFTVTNGSSIATGAVSITPAGSDPGAFIMTADSCSGAPLMPSTSCMFAIAFHPTATGPRSAAFDLSANPGGNRSVSVSGTGI